MNVFASRPLCGFKALVIALAFVSSALADNTCAGGTVESVLGATCDIGTLKFTFTGYRSFSDGGLALSAQDVLLSPNPTSPLEPSFTLSGNLTAAEAPGSSFAEQYVELDYTAVTVSSGGRYPYVVAALGTSFDSGAGNFQFDPSNPFGSGLLAVGNCVGTPSICDAGAGSATAAQILDGQLVVTNSFPNPDLVSFAPLSEFSGLAYVNIWASGGVTTVSIHDSTASFDVNLATPEPGTLGLMTVGSLGLGFWRKRKAGRTARDTAP
ncbi:MAG TPA: PEP-CTERM sorting domain-containing protein [Terriglobia bacterium]|nr:PEP-CTERM sorting domain-containing protein [Terriglobia bacterium]